MPEVSPFTSPLHYIGVFVLLFGGFLILAGFRIIKVEKVSVEPGIRTWGTGLILCLIGAMFLFPEILRFTSSIIEPDTTNMPTQSIVEIETPTKDLLAATVTTKPESTQTTSPESTSELENNVVLNTIGYSVQDRPLTVAKMEIGSNKAILVVGNIQGDQSETRDLANEIINYYEINGSSLPFDADLYVIPSINPDGYAVKSRFNANDVDINRNWNTSDWVANASVPGYPDGKSGAGGNSPFSEPETRSLRDFTNNLAGQYQEFFVILFHSSVYLTKGQVFPNGEESLSFAQTYANTANYSIEDVWHQYTPTGEFVSWCDEKGILAIDVVFPVSQSGTNTLLDDTLSALVKVSKLH